MLINDKLKARRKEIGLTMAQVAEKVGVSEATVSRWESGDISNMKRDRIAAYANALNVSPAYIMGMDDPLPSTLEKQIMTNIYNIPVYETVSAGFGAYAENQIIEYIPITLCSQYEADITIGIRVAGDSMYPKIEDGDIVVVRKQNSVDSGDIAVILLDGDDGLVKKVKYDTNWVDLISFNPEYKTKHFEGDDELSRLRVVGKVIGSYKKFD